VYAMSESAVSVPPAPHAVAEVAPRKRGRRPAGRTEVTVVRNSAAPAPADCPGPADSLFGSRGALLGVVPLGGGARLAIVGYLLPHAGSENSDPLASRQAHGLVVDLAQHRALVHGRDADLLFREFELLAFLTARPGRAFTRAQLLTRVWGDGYQGSTRTVDVHIHRLRRKLGPEYGRRLVTMRHLGYAYQPPSGSEDRGLR
jgi:hypothetical protein